MTMKTLSTQALTTAFFISISPGVICQQGPAPEAAKSKLAAPVGVRISGGASAKTGVATIDEAEFVTTTPEPGTAPPSVKRAGSSTRYVVAREREDISPIVVRFSDNTDGSDKLQEDLSILTVRIRTALESGGAEGDVLTRPDAGVFRSSSSSSSVRAMYLEGFGAVIFVKSGFPLLAPAAPAGNPEPAADSEWNRAKQELLAEKRRALVMDSFSGQPYDAAQVETLKSQILGALKDATNIKSIKPGDFVAVSVFGPPAASSAKGTSAESRGTVLTIRVKKSEIDAFAASRIDAAKFKESATITAYLGNGYGITSLNSWAKGGSLQVR